MGLNNDINCGEFCLIIYVIENFYCEGDGLLFVKKRDGVQYVVSELSVLRGINLFYNIFFENVGGRMEVFCFGRDEDDKSILCGLGVNNSCD